MENKENKKLNLISLGCAKNLVDSEILLGGLNKTNIDLTDDPEKADTIVVNTCGFLDIASNKFKELAAKAMFCINFSVSESQSNAMLHAMKTGLIPIIDKDSGSFDYKYGLILDIMNESFNITRKKLVDYVEAFSWAEYQRQSKYIAKFIKNNHNYELFKRQFLESLK